MADKKISALTAATTPLAGTEVLPIVQSGATVKVSIDNLTAGKPVSMSNLTYTGTLTGSTGVINIGSGQFYKDASGNVGVGATSPTANLQVYANSSTEAFVSRFTNGSSASNTTKKVTIALCLADTVSSQKDVAYLTAYPDGVNVVGGGLTVSTQGTNSVMSERMRVDSGGIVTMNAYGAGAATFSAAGVISSVSDETWKIKDGVPVDPDSMLKKLEPGYWYYNDKKKEIFGTDRQLGFYAQNVNAAIGPEAAPQPEVVTTKALDGTNIVTTKPWGYYDRSVLAVTVMSLQKALATIESLTARIETLEAKQIS